jgi:hypothetical protein
MTTEGSTTPESSTPPPAAVEAPAPPKQASPPAHAPIPGTKYVLNEKTGLYDVHRVDEAGKKTVERGEDDVPEHLRSSDSKEGGADETGGLQLAEHLPPEIRDDPVAAEHLREVSTALDAVSIQPDAKQRLVDLAMDLHAADLATGMPQLWNREANEGVLRQRWGSAYDERVARAQAAAKALGLKFLAWCDRTQAGNSPALLETLALMADKDKLLTLSPAAAAAKMKEWRNDPKSPLRNSLHPEHAVALAKARVLAIIAEGKGRQGNVEELAKDRQDAEAKAKGEPVDDATAKLDAEITAIRLDKGYSNPSAANHKALVARMQELKRQRWPD